MSSVPKQTRQWIVSNPPKTNVSLSGDDATFKLETVDTPSINDGQVLVKLKYLSNDPAQRGWIQDGVDAERLYVPPVRKGDVMRSFGIGEIVQSKAENLKEGQLVSYMANWSDYRVLEAKEATPIQEEKEAGIKATHFIGALGGPGLTAFYGLVKVAEAKAEDTVVVSGAAGSTGSMAVQIAKHVLGCKRVIGIAGGQKKCDWVKSLGADDCIDYKSADFEEKLIKATDGYVEVYFDNVGGHILDSMLKRIKRYGRVAVCGSIATYNDPESTNLKNWFEVIANRIELKGFIVYDAFLKGNGQEMVETVKNAVKDKKIQIEKQEETIVPTKFEEIPKTWTMLFEGGNQGKLVTELTN